MNVRLVLVLLAAVCTSISENCPFKCTCELGSRTLCNRAFLTEVPGPIPDTTKLLDLSYNNISELTDTTFQGKEFGSIVSLYLYNNAIQYISQRALIKLKSLKMLYIYNNKLRFIYSNTFIHNLNLEDLDLHANNISIEGYSPFRNLPSLRYLNLKNCNLRNLPKNIFENTPKLQVLNMSNNNLSHIDDHLFNGLESLKTLNLSGNYLTSLNFLFAIQPKFLRFLKLDVKNNKLSNLTDAVLRQMSYLQAFDVKNNPLYCKCFDTNFKVKLCSEYTHNWTSYLARCLTMVITTSTTTTTTKPTFSSTLKTSVSTATTHERSQTITKHHNMLNKPSSPIVPSAALSDTDVIVISVTLSVTFIILAFVSVICFYVRLKTRTPMPVDYDTVPQNDVTHDGHCQDEQQEQRKQCQICRIYVNHTPNCEHRTVRRNFEKPRPSGIQYAVEQHQVAELETFEPLCTEENEECVLCIAASEERNSMTSHVNTSLPPDKNCRSTVVTNIEKTHPFNSVYVTNDFYRAGGTSTFPRHAWRGRPHSTFSKPKSYLFNRETPYRNSCIDTPRAYIQSPSWPPTTDGPFIPERVESLMNRHQRRPLPQSPEQNYAMQPIQIPKTDHVYEEVY